MDIVDWGIIDYKQSLDQQLDIVENVINKKSNETLVFCKHPSVVTLGKKSKSEDLGSWSGQTYTITRGGSVTYHGEQQLVAYPILNLEKRNFDIHKYLRDLEKSCIKTLEGYDVLGYSREGHTGVWVNKANPTKIASIGVAVKKWITYHGMAINLNKDDLAFKGINPCGYDSSVMTSLQELKKTDVIDEEIFKEKLKMHLVNILSK